jgi:hypothetical protein
MLFTLNEGGVGADLDSSTGDDAELDP